MKTTLRRIAALLLVVIFSVGFRYSKSGFNSIVNIYLADSLLLIAEEYRGLDIYSIANVANPRHLLTIPLRQISGMAMKDSIIYTGSWDGILTFKLTADGSYDTTCMIQTTRCCMMEGDDIVVADNDNYLYMPLLSCGCATPVQYDVAAGASETGGGSYATFAIIDTFLYFVDYTSLVTLSISTPEEPVELSRCEIGWAIETLYPLGEYLYIGGTTGMYAVDRSDPARPVLAGQLEHFEACDPVVVQDTIAFVTLRGGNRCGNGKDELLVVSVADPEKPRLLQEHKTLTPYGLAAADTLLYVANGSNGYRLYRIKESVTPILMKAWDTPQVKDFILRENRLYVMGFSGIDIMDVTNPESPETISSIY